MSLYAIVSVTLLQATSFLLVKGSDFKCPDVPDWHLPSHIERAILIGDDATVTNLIHGCGGNPDEAPRDLHAGGPAYDPPLVTAARFGRVALSRTLLELGADINVVTKVDGKTPLMIAIERSDDELVTLFARSKGVDVDLVDNHKRAPVHFASSVGDVESLKILLETGISDVSAVDRNGESALHIAVERDYADIVDLLLAAGHALDTPRPEDGATALHLAARSGHWRIVRSLIKRGADVNFVDHAGYSPLLAAATSGSPRSVRLLLQADADPNLAAVNKWTPLRAAVDFGHTGIVLDLLEDKRTDRNVADSNGLTPLHAAADRDRRKIAIALMKNGGDVMAKASGLWNQLPIHLAAANGNNMLVAEFARHDRECIDALDELRRSPAAVAAEKRMTEVLSALCVLRADFDQKEAVSTLSVAARSGCTECIRVLFDCPRRTHSFDLLNSLKENLPQGVVSACQGGQVQAAKALLMKHPHPKDIASSADPNGMLPLFAAVSSGSVEMVAHLVDEWGVDPKLTDASGATALHVGAMIGAPDDVIEFLILSGADINAKNADGMTCLELAVSRGNNHIVDIIREHSLTHEN